MRITTAVAMLAAGLSIAAAVPAAADTLTVTPGVVSTDPLVRVRAFVPGGYTGPFGQSFTAIDSTLNSIGFQYETLNADRAGLSYTLSLFAGETLTGTALVTQTFSLPTAAASTPTWFDINIGSVAATIGQQYTLVFSSSDFRNGIVLGPDTSYHTNSLVSGDTYAGGRFFSAGSPVYSDCPNTPSSPCDLNFRVMGTTAAVTPVPEPVSWALMLGGFGMMGGALRRRRADTNHTAAIA